MCPNVLCRLTCIDDVTLVAIVTKTNLMQCAPTRPQLTSRREQHMNEKLVIQIISRRQTQMYSLHKNSFKICLLHCIRVCHISLFSKVLTFGESQ